MKCTKQTCSNLTEQNKTYYKEHLYRIKIQPGMWWSKAYTIICTPLKEISALFPESVTPQTRQNECNS